MRTRILRALAAAALAAGIGMTAVVATQASADSTPSAAAEVLSTTERGLCVRVGTGAPAKDATATVRVDVIAAPVS